MKRRSFLTMLGLAPMACTTVASGMIGSHPIIYSSNSALPYGPNDPLPQDGDIWINRAENNLVLYRVEGEWRLPPDNLSERRSSRFGADQR